MSEYLEAGCPYCGCHFVNVVYDYEEERVDKHICVDCETVWSPTNLPYVSPLERATNRARKLTHNM